MRVRTNLQSGRLGFNMTPMIDVVFLLIIFFLVSSHLAKQEAQMELPLPTAESGNEPMQDASPRLTINVLRDGTLKLSGHEIRADQLHHRLSAKFKEVGSALQVRIRSHRSAPYRFVEPIMLACARAGIWDVSFAVYRSEDVR